MFSLKNRKPFVTYYKEKNRASRFLDLKQRFGFNNIVTDMVELKESLSNSYDAINYIDRIQENIERSKLFLKKSLD